jgi:stage IV sporulation protein FB
VNNNSTSLKFRLFGFPITIGLAFPLFLGALGWASNLTGALLIVWVVFGTVAILLHELGHALAFRRFGLESSIQFWFLGGLAFPNDQEAAARMPDGQMLLVALAGPAVGLVLGAVGLAAGSLLAGQSHEIRDAAYIWVFVNLGWGIFNLLPIASLDGGRVLRHTLLIVLGERGRVLALAATIVAGAGVAALAIANGYVFVGLIAIVFGLANPYQYQELLDALMPGRAERRRQREAAAASMVVAHRLEHLDQLPPARSPLQDGPPPDPYDRTDAADSIWQRPG